MEQILTAIESAHLLRCSRAHVQNVVGAVEQFERDLIAERVKAGMAHARATQVRELRQNGLSLRAIAQELSVPVPRVRRSLAASFAKTPNDTENLSAGASWNL